MARLLLESGDVLLIEDGSALLLEATDDTTGTLSETLDNVTVAAAGASGAAGTLTETLEDATLAAEGESTPPGVAGSLTVTLADTTVDAAGTFTDSGTPPVDVPPPKPSRPTPRLSQGRIITLKATADLGDLTAYLSARVELADEELIELL